MTRKNLTSSALVPGLLLPISLYARRANENTRKKGRNRDPSNPHVHAFRGSFSSGYSSNKGVSYMSNLINFSTAINFLRILGILGILNCHGKS